VRTYDWSSLIVTVLRQTMWRWAWSGPGEAWFGLDYRRPAKQRRRPSMWDHRVP